MTADNAISEHYLHGSLLHSIQESLIKLGKDTANISIEDLSPVDEFHIGGRRATVNLFTQVPFSKNSHILDIGCGLGGPARFIAKAFGLRVTGIDLTQEYIDTGNQLSEWTSLREDVELCVGNATSMEFDDNSFDGSYMIHVGMNIPDKLTLFREVYRILKPNTYFAIYDIMRLNNSEINYPVPWASTIEMSNLEKAESYIALLKEAGFKIISQNNRINFALEVFGKKTPTIAIGEEIAPLSLHTLMKESAATKITNMIEGIRNNAIAPTEIIVQKTE